MNATAAGPRVSVIMANFNGAAHIAAAVRSVLRQTETALELIVSDDGSTDDSLAMARNAAAGDPRLIIVTTQLSRTGPAAARNRALAHAQGDWIAIVDNDDYIHPERLKRLIDAAEADGADIAADDLLTFYDSVEKPPHAHLRGALADRDNWIKPWCYERTNRLLGPGPALGYLKPVFRRALGARYDETLRIGEDSELILRLMIAGARLRLYPALGYFYRKHDASISHRLDLASIDALDAAYSRLDPGEDSALKREIARGAAARADAKAFTKLIDGLKAKSWGRAMSAALNRPSALRLLKDPLLARLNRTKPRTSTKQARVTLISRQRIVGATNGSSAYVLALAGALSDAGYAVDYLGASPKLFGRWAMLKLRPETRVFDRYLVRGGFRAGNIVLARDPRIWLASAMAVADRALSKVGINGLSKPAEYAQGATATRADQLWIARNAAPNAAAVLCDYAFTSDLAPYALSPNARSAIVMHDLMSARVADAAETNTVKISAEDEFRMLSLTDAVIAIQHDEAARVRMSLPHSVVITAPHSTQLAPAPQPGEDDLLLFVGSNTAPNVVGLEWFFREIWPLIRAKRAAARLKVAGSVARALGPPPEGVTMLGLVGDLEPLYAEAGVVISPLYTGSGLKIKLVEALAAGKAVVGTSVTAQGIEPQVVGAMAREDEPARFADACVALLGDRDARATLSAAALACANEHFSAAACFRGLTAFVRGDEAAPARISLPTSLSQSQ
ncbi:MAG TPA: glycosyltransferase [Vitreimonas sp.]|uniref:glycosyltransferase n=1 Tax=Vitreimonas sp. TaxID=3069702 RepID=UPI002D2DFBC9|nr:glycosyltransferase [Vitreimonas sp.]HYD88931.1 glycosyltransferase [Vitreimonas sp.]